VSNARWTPSERPSDARSLLSEISASRGAVRPWPSRSSINSPASGAAEETEAERARRALDRVFLGRCP
jgi:hypothetical protein